MRKKSVLVVWSELPEKVCFVVLKVDDVSELLSFHGQYCNACEPELSQRINEYFYDDSYGFRFARSEAIIEDARFDYVIMTGITI